ncbi:hypothetical protein WQQ_15350 [Hydrocarboniphaga effusa AP103]|uniref:Uncharacterized protein n=1 Tax=Hydrocarboniphaga effusa AP103 TaxID=1172194 RepID=I8TCK4_9GAMM|nr:hypothetical protein WQQ_15350 [Hydrocarboniphaga effusa AP103]
MKPQITGPLVRAFLICFLASKELRHEAADHQEEAGAPDLSVEASKELRHEAADHQRTRDLARIHVLKLQRSCGMKPQITRYESQRIACCSSLQRSCGMKPQITSSRT